jgi:uncharacterized protein YlaN (UPF0358 family)
MSSEIVQSTQPTDEPEGAHGHNELASFVTAVRSAAANCDHAISRDDVELRKKLKRQLLDLANGLENLVVGNRTDPIDWRSYLNREALKIDFDCVSKYTLRVFANAMERIDYGQPAPTPAYLHRYWIYDAIFRGMLPEKLRQEGRQHRWGQYSYDSFVSAADNWPYYNACIQKVRTNLSTPIGCATGIGSLDDALGGGICGLTVVGGDPNVGKTTLAIQIAKTALSHDPGLCAVYCSLDRDKKTIYDALACQEARITYRDYIAREHDQFMEQRIQTARENLGQGILRRLKVRSNYRLPNCPGFPEVIKSDLEGLATETDATRFLIVIDSRRKIPIPTEPEVAIDPDGMRLQQIECIKAWRDCVTLVISEVRKSDDRQRELFLEDLRGSSDLGYAADNVLLIWQEADHRDAQVVPTTLRIAKGRDGVQRRDITLNFDHEHYRFLPVETKTSAPRPAASNVADPLGGHEVRR